MALRSMTGYGRGQLFQGDTTYTCEIRTLNNRFLDVSARLPRSLIALESSVISAVKKRLYRGKIDVFLDIQSSTPNLDLPVLNHAVVKHYATLLEELQTILQGSLVSTFASLQDPTAYNFFMLEGVLQKSKSSSSVAVNSEASNSPGTNADSTRADEGTALPPEIRRHQEGVIKALGTALDSLIVSREKEGFELKSSIDELLADIDRSRESVISQIPQIQEQAILNYRKRLSNISKIAAESDSASFGKLPEERLLQEIAILAEKADIEEELTRLKVHLVEFRNAMEESKDVGRKLDFLCQELHREVNTMSNKLVQLEASKQTMAMKQAIERVKQQIQNIE